MAVYNAQHVYVSTYCVHNAHEACRLNCKTCQAPCRCECHDEDDDAEA
ncbi:MAG: hypothetical protein M3N32_07840 [Actinomycetota bacterium]|nr:hypothetical protein [Actinomycetota bacterium]